MCGGRCTKHQDRGPLLPPVLRPDIVVSLDAPAIGPWSYEDDRPPSGAETLHTCGRKTWEGKLDPSALDIINPIALGGGLGVVVLVGILAFLALGRWLGQRSIARHGIAPTSGIGSLEAAVFALLGLMIAFTFSGGLSRFDSRPQIVVQEANAIGSAYLSIDLLAPSAQPGLREAMRAYADSRIATYRKLPDIAAANAEVQRSHQLQSELWSRAVAALRLPDTRAGTELVVFNALNEMFNVATSRVAATLIHPPSIIYWMLVALAVAAALLAGYQTAGEKDYDWVHKVGFAAMVALTVYVIVDIEYPRLGLVRIDGIDRVLIDVRAGMK